MSRFVDLRFTAGGLAVAALLAFILTRINPDFSFGATFGVIVVAWLLVGLSTLADDG